MFARYHPACCWPAVLPLCAHAQKDAAEPRYGHEFPTMFALEEDWVDFNRDPLPLKATQALLDKDADGSHVVSLSDIVYSSVWTQVDRWLKKHPDVLAALRAAQNRDAPAKLFGAKRSGDPARLMAVCRSYPWAQVVHESLIETAEHLLRDGDAQLALRCFDDVLKRSEDTVLHRRAQVGVWLAMAHAAESIGDIAAMFRDSRLRRKISMVWQAVSSQRDPSEAHLGDETGTDIPGAGCTEHPYDSTS